MDFTLDFAFTGSKRMTKRSIRAVATRVALGIAAASFITWVAYRFHFNLSSATSVHLFMVTAIALRWGFIEASMYRCFPWLASTTSSPSLCSGST
jgi:hypothetical protein